jgi:hypothetical protein
MINVLKKSVCRFFLGLIAHFPNRKMMEKKTQNGSLFKKISGKIPERSIS